MNKDILNKYISGDATEEEKIEIMEWLDSAPENMEEYLALRKLYDIMIWQTPAPEKKTQFVRLNPVLRKITIEGLKIAATFIIAFLGIHYYTHFGNKLSEPDMNTVIVPAGQHAELMLSDGTKVWLNAKSKFTFPKQFNTKTREVRLDGEGYFCVAKDKEHPFIVETQMYDIKVLGTEFNVTAYKEYNMFEASLLEGSVQLQVPGSGDGLIMKPNERVYLENNQLIKGPIINYNQFSWKQGIINFYNESFPEILKKLELYYDIKIQVKNKAVTNFYYTGKFRTNEGLEHILKVFQLNNDFRYKIDNTQNIVTIE